VTRIEHVCVPRTQDKYLSELQDIAGLTERKVAPIANVDAIKVQSIEGLDLNEYLMYHGAPGTLVSRLMHQGLDPRYAGTHFGKLYGAGIYLATNASKSDIYTTPATNGERCVLVVRACLGEAHLALEACPDLLKPPERDDGRGPLNSVVAETSQRGGAVEHPEYVVYKETQALPEYAIWYRHLDECRCTHCITSVFVEVSSSCLQTTVKLAIPGDVQLADKVEVLKAKVFARLQNPSFTLDETQLTLGSKTLQNHRTLSREGVREGSQLSLVAVGIPIYVKFRNRKFTLFDYAIEAHSLLVLTADHQIFVKLLTQCA